MTTIHPTLAAKFATGIRKCLAHTKGAFLVGIIACGGQGHATPTEDSGVPNLMAEPGVSRVPECVSVLHEPKAIKVSTPRVEIGCLGFRERLISLGGHIECGAWSNGLSVIVVERTDGKHRSMCWHYFDLSFSTQAVSRGLAEVLQIDCDPRRSTRCDMRHADVQNADICPKLPFGCALSSLQSGQGGVGTSSGLLHRSAGQRERIEQPQGAESRESSLPPSSNSLGFGSISGSLCGGRRPLLGYEIVSLTLLGALFAPLGVLGLLWIFDDPDRKRRALGCALVVVSLACTITLYGWARLGAPGSFWGLCG
ncbi:hypothetical protein [Paracraurococcus lichenis]|uniref:Uncharacterized protein n=1 Tax=Paracraurococcus lichenis TaxID=3064888 RepID=A0ABT9DVP9_9PROT|nr:hypothetical protein [Paracraurococcus sp. LOR1-02]MDO9707980.1 hypothetical protein [Paracraurococcus sp. LOR1-02]